MVLPELLGVKLCVYVKLWQHHIALIYLQVGSNMTGTICV
jgi:hypothetical protein